MENSFLFAANAVAPILITVLIGYFLKKGGLLGEDVAKAINKLVFRILLPVMLFNNVYKISDFGSFDAGYIIYAVVAVIVIFCLALLFVILFTKDPKKRASLLQSTFRSNYALIGIPLAESLFGAEESQLHQYFPRSPFPPSISSQLSASRSSVTEQRSRVSRKYYLEF